MQSIFNMRTVTTLAMGALLGGNQAMAWCPTPGDRTISCSNCTRVLTCNVTGLNAINITGSNVTFDGNWYSLTNGISDGIYVAAGKKTTVIRNLYIDNPTRSGIYAVSSIGDMLYVENVYAYGGTHGLAHYYGGSVQVFGGSFWDNEYGIAATFGSSNAGSVGVTGSSAWANTRYGLWLQTKPWSVIQGGFSSSGNGWGGALVEQSKDARIFDSYFDNNTNWNRNGLRLVSSNNAIIAGNSGFGNGSYDCITVSSTGVTAYSNTWGTYSGSCN